MILTDIQKKVLELATEDYYGLWEIIDLYKNSHVVADRTKVHEFAKKEILIMIKMELIRLYSGKSLSDPNLIEDMTEADTALSNPQNWVEPEGEKSDVFFIGATEKGEAYYFNRFQENN